MAKLDITLTQLFSIIFGALAVFYYLGTSYDYSDVSLVGRYGLIQDVHVMVFIGFAFLMSFLHNSGLTATSHATLIAVLAVLWAILVRGWIKPFMLGQKFTTIPVNLGSILNGDFAAAACLISFGAVIGRVTAGQMLVMVLIEVVLYAINEVVVMEILKAADIGGATIIHEFGAYFGLAMSWMLNRLCNHKKMDRSNNKATRMTDTYAMVGTLFLFCFWPSFTSVMAGPTDPATQQRAFVNTFLAMSSAAFCAFGAMQVYYNGKFRMVEVQNSTLAAGVAFGILADMAISPAGAVVVGGACGVLSVVGYASIQAYLEEKFDLLDTCGINNLHGMPALFGALVSCYVTSQANQTSYNGKIGEVFVAMLNSTDGKVVGRTGSQQATYQFGAAAFTFAIAVAGGLATAYVLSLQPPLKVLYDDAEEYEVEADEEGDKHHDEKAAIKTKKTKDDKEASSSSSKKQVSDGQELKTIVASSAASKTAGDENEQPEGERKE